MCVLYSLSCLSLCVCVSQCVCFCIHTHMLPNSYSIMKKHLESKYIESTISSDMGQVQLFFSLTLMSFEGQTVGISFFLFLVNVKRWSKHYYYPQISSNVFAIEWRHLVCCTTWPWHKFARLNIWDGNIWERMKASIKMFGRTLAEVKFFVLHDHVLNCQGQTLEMLDSRKWSKLAQRYVMSCFSIVIFAIEWHRTYIGCCAAALWPAFSMSNIFLLCISNKNCTVRVNVPGRFASTSTALPWSCSCSISIKIPVMVHDGLLCTKIETPHFAQSSTDDSNYESIVLLRYSFADKIKYPTP